MSLIQGGVGRLLGEADPCPVCGIPHCPGHPSNTVAALGRLNFEEWSDDPPKERITMADSITVTERVWEEVPAGGRSKRTTRVLRAAPGATLTAEEAKRLNVGKDGTQSKVPSRKAAAGSNIFDSGVGATVETPESAPIPEAGGEERSNTAEADAHLARLKGEKPKAAAKRGAKKAAAKKATPRKRATAKKAAKKS